ARNPEAHHRSSWLGFLVAASGALALFQTLQQLRKSVRYALPYDVVVHGTQLLPNLRLGFLIQGSRRTAFRPGGFRPHGCTRLRFLVFHRLDPCDPAWGPKKPAF